MTTPTQKAIEAEAERINAQYMKIGSQNIYGACMAMAEYCLTLPIDAVYSAGITDSDIEDGIDSMGKYNEGMKIGFRAGAKWMRDKLPATPPSIVADSAGEYTENDLMTAYNFALNELSFDQVIKSVKNKKQRLFEIPPTSKAESVSEGEKNGLGISDAAELMYSGGKNLSHKEAGALEKSFEKSIKIQPVSEEGEKGEKT